MKGHVNTKIFMFLQIRVNAVNPTVVLTDMGKKAWEGDRGVPMKNQIPQGKFAGIEICLRGC